MIILGIDPSFKGCGLCFITEQADRLICEISQIAVKYVEKSFAGYCMAARNISNKITTLIGQHINNSSGDIVSTIMECPPAGAGAAFMSQALSILDSAIFLAIQEHYTSQIFIVPPGKAGWLAKTPRKISRSDRKRISKEFALETLRLQKHKMEIYHRETRVPDIDDMKTKAGKPKAFKMTDNEAEAFLFTMILAHKRLGLSVPNPENKHWRIEDE